MVERLMSFQSAPTTKGCELSRVWVRLFVRSSHPPTPRTDRAEIASAEKDRHT